MRFLILAAALGAVAIPATAASAQYYRGGYGQNNYGYDNRGVRQEQRMPARAEAGPNPAPISARAARMPPRDRHGSARL